MIKYDIDNKTHHLKIHHEIATTHTCPTPILNIHKIAYNVYAINQIKFTEIKEQMAVL